MGHAGQICGVVSGALMAIGLAKGITSYDREKKYACYDLAHELEKVREQDLFHTLCPRFIGDAARITAELIGLDD